MRYRFGDFEADRVAYRATRGGAALDLTPKLLDLLFHLLDRPGQLVTKEELLDAVWPNANVTENAMAQAMSDLREALGDEAASPTFIRTIARRGYRFIAPVTQVAPGQSTPAAPAATPAAMQAGATATTSDLPALAVMDFANLSADPEVAWLGAGIAETVTSDLASLDRFRVVDRWRVTEAVRRTGGTLHEVGAALHAKVMVTGGFQRGGPNLRITARLVDLERGDVLADAKVDGPIANVFALQDDIVRTFARELGVATAPDLARVGLRETGSLDAYRAFMEGWLKIESLDLDLNAPAIRDFERAIAIDPKYAIAYTGLANAEFVAYEMSRATRAPNFRALESGVEHARHAIHLDPGLAEAHATLSFLLTSALRFDESRRAAQQAVSLEPDSWRHQYRHGHALWGDARLRAFERALSLYPQFAYARFEVAMVHVARGDFATARDFVHQGAAEQDRQTRTADRFPAVGFHYLLGALRGARGDFEGAITEFDHEVEQAGQRRLYRAEYGASALTWRGHASLGLDRVNDAVESFHAALSYVDGHPRALLGLAIARGRQAKPDAARYREEARINIAALKRPDRTVEWQYGSAYEAASDGRPAEAIATLSKLLDSVPPSWVGWTIPLEPLFMGLRGEPGFEQLLGRLAERAR
ncbi:MAG TPA: winged helix-turn-helix domain-containing protein [Vicinamibacterales bacterium]|nr:winged helix-turn-helix domain-containing protein [Vicinamibacterales bacterium]